MTDRAVFFIIVIIGIITYLIRSSFIVWGEKIDKFLYIKKALRFVPAAVLPALIMPALLYPSGYLDISLGNKRLIAGILAIIVAVYKKSILLTLMTGMSALWILRAF